MVIQPGSTIQGPRWPELIKVDLVEDLGDYIRIVGATVNSRAHIDQVLPKSELDDMKSGEQGEEAAGWLPGWKGAGAG